MADKCESILIDFNSPIRTEEDLQKPLVAAPTKYTGGILRDFPNRYANPFDLLSEQINTVQCDNADPFECAFDKASRYDLRSELGSNNDGATPKHDKSAMKNALNGNDSSLYLSNKSKTHEFVSKGLTFSEKVQAYKSKLQLESSMINNITSENAVPNSDGVGSKVECSYIIDHSAANVQSKECTRNKVAEKGFESLKDETEKCILDESSSCLIESISDSIMINTLDIEDSPVAADKKITSVRSELDEERRVGELVELELNKTIEMMSKLSTSMENSPSGQRKAEGEHIMDIFSEDVMKEKFKSRHSRSGSLDLKLLSRENLNASYGASNKSGNSEPNKDNIKAIVAERVQRCIQRALNDSRTNLISSHGSTEIDNLNSSLLNLLNKDSMANSKNHRRSFSSSVLDKDFKVDSENGNKGLPNSDSGISGLYLEGLNCSFYKRRLDYVTQTADEINSKRSRISNCTDVMSKSKLEHKPDVIEVNESLKKRSRFSSYEDVLSKARAPSSRKSSMADLNTGFMMNSGYSISTTGSSLADLNTGFMLNSGYSISTTGSSSCQLRNQSLNSENSKPFGSTLSSISTYHLPNSLSSRQGSVATANSSKSPFSIETSLPVSDGSDTVFLEARSLAWTFQHNADNFDSAASYDSSDDADDLLGSKKPWELSKIQLPSLDSGDEMEGVETTPALQLPSKKEDRLRSDSVSQSAIQELRQKSFEEALLTDDVNQSTAQKIRHSSGNRAAPDHVSKQHHGHRSFTGAAPDHVVKQQLGHRSFTGAAPDHVVKQQLGHRSFDETAPADVANQQLGHRSFDGTAPDRVFKQQQGHRSFDGAVPADVAQGQLGHRSFYGSTSDRVFKQQRGHRSFDGAPPADVAKQQQGHRSFDGALPENQVDPQTDQKLTRKSLNSSDVNKENQPMTLRRSVSTGSTLPLSRDSLQGLAIQSRRQLGSSPLVPPLPLPPAPKTHKALTEPHRKGPMKAVIPLGSMIRNPVIKDSAVTKPQSSSGSSVGSGSFSLPKLTGLKTKISSSTKMKPVAQSTPVRNREGRTLQPASKIFSPIERQSQAQEGNRKEGRTLQPASKIFSPIERRSQAQEGNRDSFVLNRSSSATSGIPLTSVTSRSTSLGTLSTGHERSRSMETSQPVQTLPQSSSPVVKLRKYVQRLKPPSTYRGLESNPKLKSTSDLEQPKTPLKPLTKNSPCRSRLNQLARNFKRINAVSAEKENVIPQ